MIDDSNINQILKDEIGAQYEKMTHIGHRSSFYIIARALLKLGIDQSKAKAGGGWTCGNHTKVVRNKIQAQLEKEYAEETLNDLISHCFSGEYMAHHEAILCDLCKMIPLVCVNGILQNIANKGEQK